ncbi:MAG: ABC transporter substrate-binding protein [Chloroflexi bacterium]|nr:ABC transporter substrate-binding protein [Chloroflexota bacterium]
MTNVITRWLLVPLAVAALALACDDGEDSGADSVEPLRIGYLADRSGSLAELGDVISVGVELAVQHINEAGGVLGRDVELLFGDTKVNPTQGVEEARRLVEVEGVQAIVGAISSTVTLAVTESVIGPSGVVMITPSASSPALSTSNDNDFLFRSAPSDVAKGVVLAALAEEEGLDNVGLLYRDDAYGQGSAEVFINNFAGNVTAASYSALGQPSYLAELQQAASGGAELLVVIAFPGEAEVFLRESIENEVFTKFVFADATRSEDLAAKIGAEHIDGMKGTAPGSSADEPSTAAWNRAYIAQFGEEPARAYVRGGYDAVIAIALAAEAAGATDSTAIRDQLRNVVQPPGQTVIAGPEGIAAALEAVRNGEEIDYDGAASPLDWNATGDLQTGFVEIWEYRGGKIVPLESRPFDLR